MVFQILETILFFCGGLTAGLTLAAVMTTRYWLRRAETRQTVVIGGRRLVVLSEPDYLELCRASRAPAPKPKR